MQAFFLPPRCPPMPRFRILWMGEKTITVRKNPFTDQRIISPLSPTPVRLFFCLSALFYSLLFLLQSLAVQECSFSRFPCPDLLAVFPLFSRSMFRKGEGGGERNLLWPGWILAGLNTRTDTTTLRHNCFVQKSLPNYLPSLKVQYHSFTNTQFRSVFQFFLYCFEAIAP